jgi:hypothetical protein
VSYNSHQITGFLYKKNSARLKFLEKALTIINIVVGSFGWEGGAAVDEIPI